MPGVQTTKPTSPDSVHDLFGALVNEGDLDNLMKLYENRATLVARDGHQLSGTEAIRNFLKGLLSVKPKFTIHRLSKVEAGDGAVMISKWEMTGTSPDGSQINDSGQTYDILRRQRDGTWKVVIDNPYSTLLT
jgi:uncharacterized protein (TIGR02246 family)